MDWLHKFSSLKIAREQAKSYFPTLKSKRELDQHLNRVAESYSYLRIEIWFWTPFIALNLALIQYLSEDKSLIGSLGTIMFYFFLSWFIKHLVMAHTIKIAGCISEYHEWRIYTTKLAPVHGAFVGFTIALVMTHDFSPAVGGLVGGAIFGYIAKRNFPNLRVPFLG